MNTQRGLWALCFLLLAYLASPGVAAQEEEQDRFIRNGPSVSVFGQEILIPANVVQRAPVVCIGCTARIEGEIRDNVVVVFGELEMDQASVRDNVVGVFSTLTIRDSEVGEQLVNVLGSLDRDGVNANVINIGLPFGWAPRVTTILFWLRAVGLLLIFVTLVGAVSIAPERVDLLAREAPVRYFSAFFAGLLGYLAFLMVLALLSITVIGLPAGILFFKVLKWVGIAGIFLSLGRRVGRSFGREMSPLGAVLLSFGFFAGMVLLLGWLGFVGFVLLIFFRLFFLLMFEVPAVGLMILTRFGTRGSGGDAVFVPAAAGPPAVQPQPEAQPPAQARDGGAADPGGGGADTAGDPQA
jgi:hypothetical protein